MTTNQTETKLVKLSKERDPMGCQHDSCQKNAYPYGLEGQDGYMVACAEHARVLWTDQVKFLAAK